MADIHVVTIEANDPVAAAAGALGKLVETFGIQLENIESRGGDRRRIARAGGDAPRPSGDEGQRVHRDRNRRNFAGRQEDRALVVSLGTGTAIVSVNGDKIDHVSGTGVGGGTLLGLAKHMLGVSTIETLEAMARRGDLQRVDLTRARYRGRPDRRSAAGHDRRQFRQDQLRRDRRRTRRSRS